jgi:Transposase DDE domain
MKDKTKINKFKFNKAQMQKYKKRKIIESSFAWLKGFPKINCLYEKNTSSFRGFLLLAACYVIVNKT